MMDDLDVKKRISEINESLLRLAQSIMNEGNISPERRRTAPIATPGSQVPKNKLSKK